MAHTYKDIRLVVEGLKPGEYTFLETQGAEDSTRVARLVTQVRYRLGDSLSDKQFATQQGVFVSGHEVQYLVRISCNFSRETQEP